MKFLIYGATKGRGDGIGRQVAVELAGRGHEVLGFCRDAEKAAAETAFPLEAMDLASVAGQARLKAAVRDFDPDSVWSACGCGFADPLWVLEDAQISGMLEANVRRAVDFCRTCAPSCLDGGPHLILTGSTAGVLSEPGAAVYSGTKGFLVPFVRAQRAEYRRQGHYAKLSLLLLSAVRMTGVGVVADTVEFLAKQSRSMEIMIN